MRQLEILANNTLLNIVITRITHSYELLARRKRRIGRNRYMAPYGNKCIGKYDSDHDLLIGQKRLC